MKKVMYILLLSVVAASVFNACTEENVAPKVETVGGGGGGIEDPKGPR
jgi:hypothetical protein